MRHYPQPHSLQELTSDPRLALQLHHAFKKGGYLGSILERMGYALSPVPVPVPVNNSYRGRIITRDGR